MMAEIGQLVDEKYRLGQEVKNLELKALQAQINPHFLYNTLDLINWMSMRHGAAEIGTLVAALSRFYKLSLGKGDGTADLREELEHARTYVQIQNMRFENAIVLQVEVPDALLACRAPKLIIQPLVENAIFHGIMMKPEERGTVRIQGGESGGTLWLTVDDDGVGMSEERGRAVLLGSAGSSEYHGYGVRNIHERLQLAGGGDSGLSFARSPGGGTRVTIRLPR
jgi:two-component system sensor histidine kinase YesM